MAFDYAQARLDAQSLIAEFGNEQSLVKPATPSGEDPSTGEIISGSPAVTITGLMTPLLPYKESLIEQESTAIQAGDKYCFFHSDTMPQIAMQLTLNGVIWRVMAITDLTANNGTVVYVKLQMRRG